MSLPFTDQQCFFIAIVIFAVIGFQRGWRREVVSLAFILLAVLLVRPDSSRAVSEFLSRLPATATRAPDRDCACDYLWSLCLGLSEQLFSEKPCRTIAFHCGNPAARPRKLCPCDLCDCGGGGGGGANCGQSQEDSGEEVVKTIEYFSLTNL